VTSTAFLLLAMTLAVAATNWMAVARGWQVTEYVAKPLTMVLLIGVALSLDVSSEAVLGAFVVALVLSLIGDVFLMLPGEQWFVFGLGAFLAGHLAYIVGLVMSGVAGPALAVGVAIVVLGAAVVGVRVLRAVRGSDEPEMVGPVGAYIAVISVMVVCAVGTRNPFAIGGALLFYSSDALIAWNRFVTRHAWGDVVVMVTYHLGQIGLVLSLI
jgi:uncharacterized membrane protein YhhN